MYLYSREYIIGSNVLTASATVLVYDVFLTLNDEINYIWLQPWTLGTFLYWVNRYLPFADTFMALYLQMSVTNIPKCHTFYEAITWMIATGLMVSELILLLRTYAMWQRRRSILIGLGSMSFVTFGPGIALTFLEIKSFKFDEVPLGGLGCNLQTASKLIMISYVLIAFSETVVVVLTLMRGREHLRNSQSSWVKHIYRHGLLFYAYLLIITIINMVVPLVANVILLLIRDSGSKSTLLTVIIGTSIQELPCHTPTSFPFNFLQPSDPPHIAATKSSLLRKCRSVTPKINDKIKFDW
ncbi:hypothetical protein B0H34DRAFT_112391 [Crassisporium funariophilum]|nr:hypothetical protein B0H34DRAFT_112391 [Crassisporium funariophilum]